MLYKTRKTILFMLKCCMYISVILLFTLGCGSTAQPAQYTSHAVQKGETVYSIAKDYNISESTLYNLNPEAKNGIKVNSVLILPSKKGTSETLNDSGYLKHKVKKKETLYAIAQQYNVSVDDIKKWNKDLYSRGLKKGEELIIPASKIEGGIINPNIGGILPGT